MALKRGIKMNSSPRTAYMLQIHKNPDQVNKFIHQLTSTGEADVYIHIDKRNYENMKRKIVKSPYVKVLQESIICEWGDISQVDTTILLLKEVLTSSQSYDFVCLRSGQDLLVKEGFKDFLKEHKQQVFLNVRKMNKEDLGFMKISWPRITRKRYTAAHPIRIYRRLLLGLYSKGLNISQNSNQWPKEFDFYKGSQWFTIPYEVAKYMIAFLESNHWFYKFFEQSLVPDESFFHTLIMNSPFKENVFNSNLMFLKWGESFSERNSPQDLTHGDIQLIEESGQYFARKFDESKDKAVIDYFAKNVIFSNRMKNQDNEVLNFI
jgi:Core-2/I-Branching enzyme